MAGRTAERRDGVSDDVEDAWNRSRKETRKDSIRFLIAKYVRYLI